MADHDRRPPPIEVIESLLRDPDGGGADWTLVDGPWEFGPTRAVVYITQPGAFRDSFKVEVTLHVSGADREAAERYRVEGIPSIAKEFARMDGLVGKRVLLRGEPGVLTRATQKPSVGVEVEVTHADGPHRTGWSLDVVADS